MKTYLFYFLLLAVSINNSSAQKCKSDVYKRIDTIIIYDPETKIESIKIVKSTNIYLDADNCEALPKNFMADTCKAVLSEAKDLSSIELRCKGKYQADWEKAWKIQSFSMVIHKSKQTTLSIDNSGAEFTSDTRNVFDKLNSGDLVEFSKINLVHPKNGMVSASFVLQVK